MLRHTDFTLSTIDQGEVYSQLIVNSRDYNTESRYGNAGFNESKKVPSVRTIATTDVHVIILDIPIFPKRQARVVTEVSEVIRIRRH
jgi:hypothetical protein